MTDLVHLHLHGEQSALDGLGDPKSYAARAAELGQKALALTDHGVMCGLPEHYWACRKAGIEPILGLEGYYVPDWEYRPPKGEKSERAHITLLGIGEAGYQVLSELCTASHRQFWTKPLMDRPLLEALGDDAKHLVVLSGCASGPVPLALRGKVDVDPVEELLWWRETFPHFYVEYQAHGTDFDVLVNSGMEKLANKYGVPAVVTNDPHYVHEHEAEFHDALLAIQTASDIDDPDRFRFDGSGYHLRSEPELRQAFKAHGAISPSVYMKAVRNTSKIAELCQTRITPWETRSWHIPKFPDADDAQVELRRQTVRALRERGWAKDKRYVERAKEELAIIAEVGIADFLLITADVIQWARRVGIPVGPGRGSVCGSLVCFLIDIHKIDPIRYDLLFERFLNPARPRMPDIDTDFGRARRDEVYEYVSNKYGSDNVLHVAAYSRLQMKAAFHSMAKAYGVPWNDRMRISEGFAKEDEAADAIPEALQKAYPDLAAQVERFAGIKRGVSTHPGGLIIAAPEYEIRKWIPELYIPTTKKFVGQFDLNIVEEMGLLKEDFLSIKTLDVIDECLRLIEERTGERLEPYTWVPDEEEGDEEIYAMVAAGRTTGVFQMAGATNQRGCKEVLPTCFEDIVSITSLYRTGLINAGFPSIFIKNRQGDLLEFVHPELEKIIGNTWGVILYQEQIMEMGRSLAGFTMIQVDDLKESIKHKKSDLLASMRVPFIKGCMKHSGMPRSQAVEVWKMIKFASGYLFNRSHAVAYTFISYITARLKCLYPADYITALLRVEDDKKKRIAYLREAVEMGLKVYPGCVNRSGERVQPAKNGIRFGFLDFAQIGPAAATKLLENRPKGGFRTIEEVEQVCNKRTFEALRDGGALRSLGGPCELKRMEAIMNWPFHDSMAKWRDKYKYHVVLPGDSDEEVRLLGEIDRITSGKTKTDKPYLTWHLKYSNIEGFDVRLWSESRSLWTLPVGSVVLVEGSWETRWLNCSVGRPSQVKVLHRAKPVET